MGVTNEADHATAPGIGSAIFHGILSPEVAKEHYNLMSTPFSDDSPDPNAPTGADAPKSEPKHRRRGRPRMNESEEMANDKRKRQIRLAQRAHRSRKEEKMSYLEGRVTELEQKMANIRRLCIGIRAAVADTATLTASSSSWQSLHYDLLQLISITEPDLEANDFSTIDLSNFLSGDNKLDLSWDDVPFNLNELMTTASPVSSDDQFYSGTQPNDNDLAYFDSLLGSTNQVLQSNIYPAFQHDIPLHGPSLTWN